MEKDYLNHRYFHKRSYYLACIAAAIEKSNEVDCKLVYEFEHGNQLKPVLRLQMSKGMSRRSMIHSHGPNFIR